MPSAVGGDRGGVVLDRHIPSIDYLPILSNVCTRRVHR
jgi:hypothetical protein